MMKKLLLTGLLLAVVGMTATVAKADRPLVSEEPYSTIGKDQLLYYIAKSKGELQVSGITWINPTNIKFRVRNNMFNIRQCYKSDVEETEVDNFFDDVILS